MHTYISSHGLSIAGEPQAHKDDIEALGVRAKPRPCPKILNDWTAIQPQIDQRNMFGSLEWPSIRRALMNTAPKLVAATAW